MLRVPEVLAPAGDRACLEAAVRAGADAVYFGLHAFNARARAANFDESGLASTMEFLHLHGVRGYVTLNTLLFDDELDDVVRAVLACEAAGVDALIVQDLGGARLARAVAPSLPLHASTQMTCTDAGAVEFARELGAERVILARELSLDDIARIRATTDVDVEVFVHGALCIAYSGQCLTSEAIGGRSANRGACAQACRLPYDLVVDGEPRDLGDVAYLLSPQDLEASELVPRLVELGVASIKIEGRLKGAEYVAATTALYRKAVDAVVGRARPPSDEDRRHARLAYSRGSGNGFLGGVDHQRLVEGRGCDHRGEEVGRVESLTLAPRAELVVKLTSPLARGDGLLVEGGRAGRGEFGGRAWSLRRAGVDVVAAEAGEVVSVWFGPGKSPSEAVEGRRVFVTDAPAADKRLRAVAERGRRRLDLKLCGQFGEAARLEGRCGSARATVELEGMLTQSTGEGISPDALREKLGKLGDTPFELGDLEVELPSKWHLPVSALNRGRRALVQALVRSTVANRIERGLPATVALSELEGALPGTAPPAGLFVLCRNLEQAQCALEAGADGVYLDFLELTGTGRAVETLRAAGNPWIGLAPPRIRKPGEEKIDRFLRGLRPDAMLVRGLGALRDGAEAECLEVGDFSLNVVNRLSAAEVFARGLGAFTPAFDLDAVQLGQLLSGRLAPYAEVVLHHPMPLFHMEHCVIAALLSDGSCHLTCGRPCERHQISLKDRAGMEHPVEADVGCRNTVFHARAQSGVDLYPRLARAGVRRFRVELVREERAEVERVVLAYRRLIDGQLEPAEVRRELRTEGGYGVVRGSLRVLP